MRVFCFDISALIFPFKSALFVFVGLFVVIGWLYCFWLCATQNVGGCCLLCRVLGMVVCCVCVGALGVLH